MGGELRDKVASGVAWSLGEKLGTILLQMVVSIVVARLLMPDDVGLMALMTFFSSLALVVVDSGFSQMLIRKGDPAQAITSRSSSSTSSFRGSSTACWWLSFLS